MTSLELALGVTLGVVGGGVLVGVLAAWWGRRKPEDSNVDVDELAVEVGRLAKQVRRITMSNVRAAAPSAQPPPELVEAPPVTPIESKQALRDRVFGRRA